MSVTTLSVAIQGQGTVSAGNLNTFTQTAQMASQLRAFTGLPGMVVMLQGITLPNDSNGGFFYWNSTGTEPDDNFNYIVPSNASVGEWERLSLLSTSGSTIFSEITVEGLSNLEGDVIISGILSESFATGLIGSGSTQGTATPLTANINIATTVASGTGFILPIVTPDGNVIMSGTKIQLLNRGTNVASLYPPSGAEIEALGNNNPAGVSPGGNVTAIFAGSAQWWLSS